MAHKPTDRDLQIARDKDAPKAFYPWEILHEPVKEGDRWVVKAEDAVLGVTEAKKFRFKQQALDFYATVLLGKAERQERMDSNKRGAGKHPTSVVPQATQLARSGKSQFDPRGRHTDGVNLKDVAAVLESYGLDPIAEIAGILVPHDVVGEDGEIEGQGYQLDAKERVKALLELTQYVRPKLKAVEVTMKEPELTDDQVQTRVQALLTKALKRASK